MKNESGSVSLAVILAGALVIPIESRFAVGPLAVGPTNPRTDFSGIVVPAGPAGCDSVQGGWQQEFWLVDDKANRLDAMMVHGRMGTTVAGSAPLVLRSLAISNPGHLPVGDDMEDLGRLVTTDASPIYVAASGETGPGGLGVSWVYLFEQRDARLTLRWSGLGSPPGESVGNNGFEGVALIRLGADTLALLGFKERPDPTYVRSFLFREVRGVHGPLVFAAAAGFDSLTLVPIERIGMDRIEGIKSQSGACVGPAGDLYVLDRTRRRIAVVDRFQLEAALRDTAENLIPAREWLDYTSLEATLENKTDPGAPLSLFGTVEGIAFDPDGRLYLLADNNEAGASTLLILVPREAGAGR